MNRGNENNLPLVSPPAIRVGPIVTPGTNETISIVIPLSAQLTTMAGQKVNKNPKECNKDPKQTTTATNTTRRYSRLEKVFQ